MSESYSLIIWQWHSQSFVSHHRYHVNIRIQLKDIAHCGIDGNSRYRILVILDYESRPTPIYRLGIPKMGNGHYPPGHIPPGHYPPGQKPPGQIPPTLGRYPP